MADAELPLRPVKLADWGIGAVGIKNADSETKALSRAFKKQSLSRWEKAKRLRNEPVILQFEKDAALAQEKLGASGGFRRRGGSEDSTDSASSFRQRSQQSWRKQRQELAAEEASIGSGKSMASGDEKDETLLHKLLKKGYGIEESPVKTQNLQVGGFGTAQQKPVEKSPFDGIGGSGATQTKFSFGGAATESKPAEKLQFGGAFGSFGAAAEAKSEAKPQFGAAFGGFGDKPAAFGSFGTASSEKPSFGSSFGSFGAANPVKSQDKPTFGGAFGGFAAAPQPKAKEKLTFGGAFGGFSAAKAVSESTPDTKREQDSFKERLVQFYTKHNPKKLDSIDRTLETYKGREEELFEKLHQLYVADAGLSLQERKKKLLTKDGDPTVFMDISISGKPAGRIVMRLLKDRVPLAAENFRCLCTGEKDPSLHFKGCKFHRIIRNFVVQGGDFTVGDGTGGQSIYRGTPHGDLWGNFKDEEFLPHDDVGLLSMANAGKNTNGSQFFITTKAGLKNLDGKHVVFGEVIEGLDVVDAMQNVEVSKPNSRPLPQNEVAIEDCGEL